MQIVPASSTAAGEAAPAPATATAHQLGRQASPEPRDVTLLPAAAPVPGTPLLDGPAPPALRSGDSGEVSRGPPPDKAAAAGLLDFRPSSLRAAPPDVGVSRQRWHGGAVSA